MGLYGGAVIKLLPENNTQPTIVPTQVIFHTAVDAPGPTSLYNYFDNKGVGAESHFFARFSGVVEQYMDTTRMANANRKADKTAVSIETEDDGDPLGRPWDPAQLDALIRLTDWLCSTHGIPRRLCDSPTSPGIGWHSMWGFMDPIAQTGPLDNPWSFYRGKICPGKTRIAQLINDVIPAVVELADNTPTETGENPGVELVKCIDVDGDPNAVMWFLVSPFRWCWIAQAHTLTFYRDTHPLPVRVISWYNIGEVLPDQNRGADI